MFSPGENDILGKAEEKMEEIEEGKKMTILIADDEARIRTLIAKYAAFEGYLTEEAEDGMQAVEMCRKRRTTWSSWM